VPPPINSRAVDERKFFRALGARIRGLRKGQRYSQKDEGVGRFCLGGAERRW
jgi:hypothetical protein